MSYSYERQRRTTYGASSQRSAWGYWIPLAVTVTVATAGLVAWIWNERSDEEEDELPSGPRPPGFPHAPPPGGYGPPPQDYSDTPPPGFQGPPGFDAPPGQTPYVPGPGPGGRDMEDGSIVARMSGALRRTPSPQQIFDGASRRVIAGVSAAGAVVGGALSSIREDDKTGFEDHSRWSEEADSQTGGPSRKGPELQDLESSSSMTTRQAPRSGAKVGGKRKTVAIVVSAETDYEHSEDAGYHQEHASILSHLPEHVDRDSRIFVLIYAPDLKQHPLANTSEHPDLSTASSYSNIGHEDAQSQGEKSPDPEASPMGSKMFTTLYTQAQAIVEKDTMIMPFTTPTGYIHLLRHLGPETVYLQQTLSGPGGDALSQISGWVGQILLVVGDESGHGGLVDSEDERGEETKDKWWHDDPRIGLGKGVEIVEGLRVGEDWKRRIGGHD